MDNRIGRAVRQLRYDRHELGLPWSQEWLARAADVGRQTVINIERGCYRARDGGYTIYTPGREILERVAWALGVGVEDLTG